MLHRVMDQGKRMFAAKSLQQISEYRRRRFDKLPAEYKRFTNPHHYKIGLSKRLKRERDQMIAAHQETYFEL